VIVRDEVAHEAVKNVRVDRNFRHDSYSTGCYSRDFSRIGASVLTGEPQCIDSGGMIKAVKFISIPVRDQQRALEFYTQKLGFAIFTDQPFDDKQRWIELGIPGAQTRIVLFTPPGQEERIGSIMNTAWSVDNIDRTYEELSAKGIEFTGPPQRSEWGAYLLMKDPDGNIICLSTM
jgi:predicted enzyme related to lactoylglutathione lyase